MYLNTISNIDGDRASPISIVFRILNDIGIIEFKFNTSITVSTTQYLRGTLDTCAVERLTTFFSLMTLTRDTILNKK